MITLSIILLSIFNYSPNLTGFPAIPIFCGAAGIPNCGAAPPKLASGFTPIDEMIKSGIKVAIGTDGSSSNNNQNMVEEIHIASIVNKAVKLDAEVVPAIEVLKMATINGSEAMGIDAGIIEEGKFADIQIYDLNSVNFTPRNNLISALCYSASSNDVLDLIVDGKLVMENRELLTLDEEYIKFMVNKKTKELLNR